MGQRGTEAAPTGPIFIGGTSRSGKTLMRWILSSHPRIVVSRRTEMWTRFYGRYGDLADPGNLDRCLRAMFERRQIAELGTDLERLRRDLGGGTATYGRLFASIHDQVAERAGKPRWGDQSAHVERFAAEIFAQHPTARFLHLIRDPRDVVAAVVERRRRRRGTVGGAVAAWRTSAAFGLRNRRRYPQRYEIVRYEDLVGRPEATMRRVCDVLGETYEPAILRMEGVRRYDEARASSPDGTPISTEYVARYRATLSRSDVAFVQLFAGREMEAFEYLQDPIQLSPAERVRSVAGWPLAIARARTPA